MLQGIKVLAVDDDEMSLEMLTTILGGMGMLCTAAANGKEAMDALAQHPDVDIILLDIQMPLMNGFEMLMQCRDDPGLRDIPVIVLSSDHQEKLNALKLGADDFMAKPYDLGELELRITKLLQSRQLAQAAQRAKQDFLSIASHELRTPMHHILGLAELLDGENLGDNQRVLVDQLKHATGDLTGIIRDILSYVQLDHGSARASAEPFSLRATLQEALMSQQTEADSKGIRLGLAIDERVSDALNGPAFYVKKVLRVLIENAVKFSSKSEIRIDIREEPIGRSCSRFDCSVSDHGIGIPEEFQEKIFEPFVQVDSSRTRKYGGIGLGLAIARRMVELMGGTISVKSSQGMGSSFSFYFYCDVQGAQR